MASEAKIDGGKTVVATCSTCATWGHTQDLWYGVGRRVFNVGKNSTTKHVNGRCTVCGTQTIIRKGD